MKTTKTATVQINALERVRLTVGAQLDESKLQDFFGDDSEQTSKLSGADIDAILEAANRIDDAVLAVLPDYDSDLDIIQKYVDSVKGGDK